MPPEDKTHEGIWSEISRMRERQSKVENLCEKALFQSEKCKGLSDKVNAHQIEVAKMGKDVEATTEAVSSINAKLDSMLGKVALVVGVIVTVVTAIAQGLWWIFQKVG